MKEPTEEIKMGAPEWVVTFGDMMSLLLTFFVLLLSFSSIEVVKFKKMAGNMREAFGLRKELAVSDGSFGATVLPNAGAENRPVPRPSLVPNLAREAIEQSGTLDSASVQVDERGVAVRVEGDMVFGIGDVGLSMAARPLLDEIVELMKKKPGVVEVEGHTDDVPIRSTAFASNWELSAARAACAARYLVDNGVSASRVKAIGYADTRPIAPNDTPENRAKNRRVEFLFIEGDGSKRSPE